MSEDGEMGRAAARPQVEDLRATNEKLRARAERAEAHLRRLCRALDSGHTLELLNFIAINGQTSLGGEQFGNRWFFENARDLLRAALQEGLEENRK